MSKRASQYDIKAMEREVRAGQLSFVNIGKMLGCSEAYVRKLKKKYGWERDLAGAVQARVKEKLVRDTVRDDNARTAPQDDDAEDENIIEAAARRGADVIQCHRKDIEDLRELEIKLREELNDSPKKVFVTSSGGKIIQKEIDISVTEKLSGFQALASATHKRIQLQRQAYNLNDKEAEKGETAPELMTREELEQIARSGK